MKNSEAILVTPKQFEIQECAVPEPKDHEILMKVEYVGMCGSDIHGFEFGPFIPPKDPNQKIGLGHEVAGEVVKVGAKVTKFKPGDKVLIEPGVPDDSCEYCRTGRYNICPDVDFMATQPNYKGALCEYMTHPEEWTYHVPEGMTTMEAALVEPAAVGMHAAILGEARLGKSIVILGAGTIGLMVLQACKSLGATDITVVDVMDKRLDLAKELGASRTINGAKEDTVALLRSEELFGDHGVELVFECAGSTFTANQAVQIVARGGKIMMVGTQSKPVPIDFLKINREVVTSIVNSGFDGIFLIAANPVDILTYSTWKFSGFPRERVIGSGTSLDSARFRQALAELVGVDARNVHAYILGEHGDSEFPVWSHANVAGLQIYDWVKSHPDINEEEIVDLFFSVRDAAYTIIEKKGATFYGIAVALARITKAILDDENAVLPLSVYMDGEYGLEDIFIGAPAVINAKGIKQVIEIPLTDGERERMHASAKQLKEIIDEAFAKLDAE